MAKALKIYGAVIVDGTEYQNDDILKLVGHTTSELKGWKYAGDIFQREGNIVISVGKGKNEVRKILRGVTALPKAIDWLVALPEEHPGFDDVFHAFEKLATVKVAREVPAKAGPVIDFAKGQAVEARFSDGKWYPATFIKRLPKGGFTVDWADGSGKETVTAVQVPVAKPVKLPKWAAHLEPTEFAGYEEIAAKLTEMSGMQVSGRDYNEWLGAEGIGSVAAYNRFDKAAIKVMGKDFHDAAEDVARCDNLLCAILYGKVSRSDGITEGMYKAWKSAQKKAAKAA